jgi:hypothetical protein
MLKPGVPPVNRGAIPRDACLHRAIPRLDDARCRARPGGIVARRATTFARSAETSPRSRETGPRSRGTPGVSAGNRASSRGNHRHVCRGPSLVTREPRAHLPGDGPRSAPTVGRFDGTEPRSAGNEPRYEATTGRFARRRASVRGNDRRHCRETSPGRRETGPRSRGEMPVIGSHPPHHCSRSHPHTPRSRHGFDRTRLRSPPIFPAVPADRARRARHRRRDPRQCPPGLAPSTWPCLAPFERNATRRHEEATAARRMVGCVDAPPVRMATIHPNSPLLAAVASSWRRGGLSERPGTDRSV